MRAKLETVLVALKVISAVLGITAEAGQRIVAAMDAAATDKQLP